jgi:hypothetical protein
MYISIGESSNTLFQSAGLACSWECADRCGFMKIPRMDRYMVRASIVLTLIVSNIFFSGEIFDVKLPLGNRISNPKEPHFHGP